jgi:hypothetical protein
VTLAGCGIRSAKANIAVWKSTRNLNILFEKYRELKVNFSNLIIEKLVTKFDLADSKPTKLPQFQYYA